MSAAAAKGHAASQSQMQVTAGKQQSNSNYKGFVAGVFSGIAKLTGMYLLYQEAFSQFFIRRLVSRTVMRVRGLYSDT